MAIPTDLDAPLADPLARACRLNYVEFDRELARWSGAGGSVAEREGVVLWATASDFPVSLNGAVRLDPRTPADRVLTIADEWFGALGRGHTVNVVDGIDDDLRAAAEAAGMLVLREDVGHAVASVFVAATRPARAVLALPVSMTSAASAMPSDRVSTLSATRKAAAAFSSTISR